MVGRTLAHYRIEEKLGEGGMGVVWKALDTQLDRPVAIKVLSEAFADDAERLARFEREAKLLASLNHSAIAGIYGLHEADGVRFIAMEFVPGEDLAERLERGRIDPDTGLELAQQIARIGSCTPPRGMRSGRWRSPRSASSRIASPTKSGTPSVRA